jgi:hypothetical protein
LGGRVVVSSSKQYREFADECLGWARTARSDRERRIFLQMAETWLQAADLADQRERRQAGTGKTLEHRIDHLPILPPRIRPE